MEFEWEFLIFIGMALSVLFIGVCTILMIIGQRKKEAATPEIAEKATFVEKRKWKKRSMKRSNSYIRFYATFEFENGVRQEFTHVIWEDYHSLVDGDVGLLTYKGQKYIKFESEIMSSRVKLKGWEAVKVFISRVIDDNYGE